MMEIVLPLVGGLILLAGGGELLVRGAVQLAQRLGVSPLLIGLTLVGFGTSTPELVTSVQAALIGSSGIAVGNIVGSNIANILLILGLSAIIFPVAVQQTALKRDGTLVLATALALTAIGYVWTLDRFVGVIFLAGLIGYIAYAYLQERSGAKLGQTAADMKSEAFDAVHPDLKESAGGGRNLLVALAMIAAGLALVVAGGHFLVGGAVSLARSYGISETVIGLTIVAVGTSMPEFITSVIAALRKQSDVALGNILGSNIYNILGIGGITALIAPTAIPAQIAHFDNWVMVATSAIMLLFLWTGLRLGRREGAALVTGYGAYVWSVWP
jgi:cation:H+ antiporter